MGILVKGQLRFPLRTSLVHEPSDARIDTVAPVSSGGDGSRFSPIDLFAASVASCGATAMSICAQRNQIRLHGVRFTVESETADDPRRVAKLTITHEIDADCSDEEFALLVEAAEGCPIRRSIHPDIQVVESLSRAPRATGEDIAPRRELATS